MHGPCLGLINYRSVICMLRMVPSSMTEYSCEGAYRNFFLMYSVDINGKITVVLYIKQEAHKGPICAHRSLWELYWGYIQHGSRQHGSAHKALLARELGICYKLIKSALGHIYSRHLWWSQFPDPHDPNMFFLICQKNISSEYLLYLKGAVPLRYISTLWILFFYYL